MKTVNTKAELCELINLVLAADVGFRKEVLIKGNSVESVYNNIMSKIIFVKELESVYKMYNTQFKKHAYEKLMQWTMNNLSDMVKSDKRKYKLDNLMMDVMNLDIYSVIKNNDDWIKFKLDLENRIGGKIK